MAELRATVPIPDLFITAALADSRTLTAPFVDALECYATRQYDETPEEEDGSEDAALAAMREAWVGGAADPDLVLAFLRESTFELANALTPSGGETPPLAQLNGAVVSLLPAVDEDPDFSRLSAAILPADDDAPAPAMVRAALQHALYDVPVEVIAQWHPINRTWARDYGYAISQGDHTRPPPSFLEGIEWDVDPETGVHSYPAQTFNFELEGRKVCRIVDRDTGRYYGAQWTRDEAKAVLAAWTNSEAALLRGETLQVRDARVALEELPKVGGGEA